MQYNYKIGRARTRRRVLRFNSCQAKSRKPLKYKGKRRKKKFTKIFKNFFKKGKNLVDKPFSLWYDIQAVVGELTQNQAVAWWKQIKNRIRKK